MGIIREGSTSLVLKYEENQYFFSSALKNNAEKIPKACETARQEIKWEKKPRDDEKQRLIDGAKVCIAAIDGKTVTRNGQKVIAHSASYLLSNRAAAHHYHYGRQTPWTAILPLHAQQSRRPICLPNTLRSSTHSKDMPNEVFQP